MAVRQQMDLVDFFVMPFEGTIGVIRTWLVHRGSPSSTYVAVCESREDAVARALALSRSQRDAGRPSAVHVQEKPAGPWRVLPD